jgi:hypothetical protein
MRKTRFVEVGRWRTLERVWGRRVRAVFVHPARARVKVRYGDGPGLGWDGPQEVLDGLRAKALVVGWASLLGARVQIEVPRSTMVSYELVDGG